MNVTVIPVAKPLYVVATGVPRFGANSTIDQLADAIDSLECVAFVAHAVHGLIINMDDLEEAPFGYLCGHRAWLTEWGPFFTAETAEEAIAQTRSWVAHRTESARKLIERQEALQAEAGGGAQ